MISIHAVPADAPLHLAKLVARQARPRRRPCLWLRWWSPAARAYVDSRAPDAFTLDAAVPIDAAGKSDPVGPPDAWVALEPLARTKALATIAKFKQDLASWRAREDAPRRVTPIG